LDRERDRAAEPCLLDLIDPSAGAVTEVLEGAHIAEVHELSTVIAVRVAEVHREVVIEWARGADRG
jgi:hypothetical protein